MGDQANNGHVPRWTSCTVREASAKTGYNKDYLRRLIRNGQVEAVRIGMVYLVHVSSLEEYIKQVQAGGDARAGPRSKRQ